MKQLQTYWYKPRHQVDGQPEVEFQLRPINQRTLLEMMADWRGDRPGAEGALAAVNFSVLGWKGLPQEFSPAARRELFDGDTPNVDGVLWAYAIAGECFAKAHVKEADAKNSESPST